MACLDPTTGLGGLGGLGEDILPFLPLFQVYGLNRESVDLDGWSSGAAADSVQSATSMHLPSMSCVS